MNAALRTILKIVFMLISIGTIMLLIKYATLMFFIGLFIGIFITAIIMFWWAATKNTFMSVLLKSVSEDLGGKNESTNNKKK